MSGDVQPRKRKDKKKKKDELSLDEPRGTAAALGEGEMFIHSYNYHGTGGHWCAKIIFFSLLAILITLIGLIILENRGLSELEANSVESRYSGILEGWIEDAPDDDHHDEHTLELKHHEDNDDEHNGFDEEDDDDHIDDNEDDDHQDQDDENDGDEHGADEDQEYDDDDLDRDDDEDRDIDDQDRDGDQDLDDYQDRDDSLNREGDEDRDNDNEYRDDDQDRDGDDDRDDRDRNKRDSQQDLDEADNEDEDEHDDDDDDDHDELEVERIEREASEEDHQEPISNDLPALPEEDDDDGKDDDGDDDKDSQATDDDNDDDNDSRGDDDDFLEADDEPPVVERITAPAGKPYRELEEDEESTEKPPDTLEQEEEYEKQQEELRREKEQSSNMWLKLSVGGALLLATHAVMRRGTAPSDNAADEHESREATPVDRRMTLIPEAEEEIPVIPKKVEESKKPVVPSTMKQAPVFKAPPPPLETQDSEEIEELEEEELEEEEPEEIEQEDEQAELYSDDDEIANEICVPQNPPRRTELSKPTFKHIEPPTSAFKHVEPPKSALKRSEPPKPEPEPEPEPEDEEPEDEDPEDVEIIEDEELSEEEDEEEISDVDDAELLSRLEAKYGRIPDPEPLQKRKDGGNSVRDMWPGEPDDPFWRQQVDSAEQELHQGSWWAAMKRASSPELQRSGRAKYIVAAALDRLAEAQRDNSLLSRAIAAYLEVLKMSESLSDKKLLDVAERTLDRIRFRGNYLNAEPVYRLLIRRFPNEPGYRNNLTISYLMANRPDLAEGVLQETLKSWPNDKVALAHYGFVLKVNNNKLEEAIAMFEKALEGDEGPACEPRFYYHYGDALLLLGRFKEAHEVHKRAAKLGHFLSPSQRSLYNVPRLKSKPWWNVEETPYLRLAKSLESSWKDILKEAEAAAAKALYEMEKEGLKERGEWSQMDLFVRGLELPKRCEKAPITCSIVKSEVAAAGCRRGQVKFSAMEPGTHVRPHVGPTNCRLRMHLGLSNTKNTYIRVDKETRQWEEGKVLLFDDSFEHEVWHNGTGKRMVLIVDVWHPDLTPQERRTLPAI